MTGSTMTPTVELDAPYSSPDAVPTKWALAESVHTDPGDLLAVDRPR